MLQIPPCERIRGVIPHLDAECHSTITDCIIPILLASSIFSIESSGTVDGDPPGDFNIRRGEEGGKCSAVPGPGCQSPTECYVGEGDGIAVREGGS